jgi:hypothetical protein
LWEAGIDSHCAAALGEPPGKPQAVRQVCKHSPTPTLTLSVCSNCIAATASWGVREAIGISITQFREFAEGSFIPQFVAHVKGLINSLFRTEIVKVFPVPQ